MKCFLFVSGFCLITLFSFGQTPQVDSLKHMVYKSKNDKDRLKAILDFCEKFETIPKDTLWNYAIKAKTLATKLNDKRGKSLATIAQINAYLRWNNTDSARVLVESELLKYKVENAATRDIYFELRQLKINCIGNTSNYKDAIADVYQVMREAEKYKDSLSIANSLNSLSGYRYEMDFPAEAISLGLKGLSLTTNIPRYNTAIMNLCGNLAEYYYWVYKLDSAMYYANKTFNLARQTGYASFQAWALQKKSAIYIKAKDYNKAEAAILECIKLDELVDGKEPHDDNLIALADVYERTKQFDKAIKVMTDGLAYNMNTKNISPHAKNNGGGFQRVFYYQELARCYHLKGDLQNYSAYLEKVVAGMDSFYKNNSAQDVAELETKYEVQKKEATIAQQRLALIKENYFFFGSLLFLLLGGVIVWLIFREFRRKQRLKMQQLHDEEKRLSVQAVADAEESERKRIAADLHDNLGAQLSFIKRNVDFIIDQPAGFSKEDEKKYLNSVNDIAQSAMIDLRETIWVLNKDEVNIQEFADKLKSYVKQQLIGAGALQLTFKEQLDTYWRLPSGEVMHIFRIVQEVISNIIKHSVASEVDIQFCSDSTGSYRLEIFDNGQGFDTSNKPNDHYGLENIGKRAKEISASLLITSDGVEGTRIVLEKG